MSRGVWFAAGAGAGMYAVVRARRLAEAVTWDGLRDRAGAAVVGLRVFAEEVAQGSADKEAELRKRLHLVPDERELGGTGLDTLASLAARPPTDPTRPLKEEN